MPAKDIILIRHGEKGNHRVDLSKVGKIRASGLASYFMDGALGISRPETIIAQRQLHRHSSDRCRETVTPLSERSNVTINLNHTRHDIDALAALLKSSQFDDQIVLICMEHKSLVRLTRKFDFDVRVWSTNPMAHHDPDAFDVTWIITPGTCLRAFKQFEIRHGKIRYTIPPNKATYCRKNTG